jgi:hypothetical protein
VRGELARIAVKLRDQHGTQTAISGMALGVDQWWAEAVLAADLNLWAYLPFPQQPDPWPTGARQAWRQLLDQATKVSRVGDLDALPASQRRTHATRLLHARNQCMIGATVQAGGAVVAVWDSARQTGGTFSAVCKAQAVSLPVIHINPATRRTGLVAGVHPNG